MACITVLNGPNLNLLGVREPALYGSKTLQDIESRLASLAADAGHQLRFFQHNAEHEIVNGIHNAYRESVDFVLINAVGLRCRIPTALRKNM